MIWFMNHGFLAFGPQNSVILQPVRLCKIHRWKFAHGWIWKLRNKSSNSTCRICKVNQCIVDCFLIGLNYNKLTIVRFWIKWIALYMYIFAIECSREKNCCVGNLKSNQKMPAELLIFNVYLLFTKKGLLFDRANKLLYLWRANIEGESDNTPSLY